MTRRILVTSALPYANGSIHLGHLVEYIQTDIWVRAQKMFGHEVHYVCADDTHGTPVMLRAEQENISPEQLIERVHQEHSLDFNDFGIRFDNYYTTNSPENQELCEKIFNSLTEAGLIAEKEVEQFYDPLKKMFLPDRYVKGTCPKCSASDQYGDSCEGCGTTYSPTELIDPYSTISGAKPDRKTSTHLFFKLSDTRCEEFLREFTQNAHRLQPEAANKMKEWLGEAGQSKLSDWDISRDAPYFGFPIPGTNETKFFYVWLDAPVGYFGSFINYVANRHSEDRARLTRDFLKPGGDTELIHFIGKDILYFHALFFPAVLQFSGFRTPTKIYAHGFLTVNGQKMSKSRGTFITARSFLESGLEPEWLRYYYAAKLNASMEDIDLNLTDFMARVNSDLVGKYINIASRAANFLTKNFDGYLSDASLDEHEILQYFFSRSKNVSDAYEAREYSKGIREIMSLADRANSYIDTQKPWELAKSEPNSKKLQEVCSVAINLFKILTVYLKPALPKLATAVEDFLNIKELQWPDSEKSLPPRHQINAYSHLMGRVDPKLIDKLIALNVQEPVDAKSQPTKKDQKKMTDKNTKEAGNEGPNEITIDAFNNIDLRVGRILEAEHVEGADKLVRLQIDLGTEQRQVLAGIKSAYNPEDLKQKLVVVVANLKARKMRFGESQGMVLAASGEDSGIFLISPESGAVPGMRVK
ncbi:MAG: methionine--tRNA ligase [Burkholderiales bacterium]|jgi:methionyl-tRNA synthetase